MASKPAKFNMPTKSLMDRSQPVASTVMGNITAPAKPGAKPAAPNDYTTILGGSRGK